MSIFGDIADDFIAGGDDDVDIEDDQLPGDSDNEGGNEDGDPEMDSVKVEPKKRSVRNPRPRLTVQTLKGDRGIHTIENYFKGMKFLGRGHEKHDLNEVMKRLQHWAHRMYPNYKFDDVLINIERLGKKKILQSHMHLYRQGLLQTSEAVRTSDQNDPDAEIEHTEEPFDEFDALLGEQIAISKLNPTTPCTSVRAPRTPATNRSNFSIGSSLINTPKFSDGNAVASTPFPDTDRNLIESLEPDCNQLMNESFDNRQPLPPMKLTVEQMAKISENRRVALERLLAKKAVVEHGIPSTHEVVDSGRDW